MPSSTFRPGGDRELRVHDGVVGLVMLSSVIVGMTVNPVWLWLAAVTSAVMFSSAFTGFCPVHFVLCKVMPPAN